VAAARTTCADRAALDYYTALLQNNPHPAAACGIEQFLFDPAVRQST
jgi:hypothetical protein